MSEQAQMPSLGVAAKSGVKWNSVSQTGQQVAQLITIAVLARLLAPSDFGLVGMATVVTGFVTLFKDLGTSAAIVQSREITEELLCSVFWTNVAVGIFGTIVLAVFAPLAASFYHEPRVTVILRVLGLSFAISGLTTLQQALLERNLEFRTLARVQVAGVGCGAVTGIGSALAGLGVWALVVQSLTNVSIVSLLLWRLSGWRPRLLFRPGEVRRIGHYSLNLVGFNTFNYFSRNADYLLIGRYLGTAPLGVYTLAYRIMLYPLQSITNVVSRVMFPVYSRLQDEDDRLRFAYLRTVGMIAFVTFPMMVGLWVVAEPFVLSVFGTKWISVVPLIKILALVGMAQSIAATLGAIYQAKARTAALFYWGIGSGTLVVCGFALGLHWGVVGVATAYAIATGILLMPTFAIPLSFIDLRPTRLAAVLVRPLAASLLMASVIVAVRTVLDPTAPLVALQVLIATGILVYGVSTWMINRDQCRVVLAFLGRK